jgi:hypothetical protein
MTEQVKRLRDLVVAGVVLYVIGTAAVFLAWPSSDGSGLFAEESGSWFWTFVGALAASGGAGMLLVGLIGYGVKYGREAVTLR